MAGVSITDRPMLLPSPTTHNPIEVSTFQFTGPQPGGLSNPAASAYAEAGADMLSTLLSPLSRLPLTTMNPILMNSAEAVGKPPVDASTTEMALMSRMGSSADAETELKTEEGLEWETHYLFQSGHDMTWATMYAQEN